ncbi:hypothetical protein NKR19_g7400 [Coniochaeta hoffmannii]|uniref:Uncharacterized protein n=1 Tax=Coniochaeta hoffmannii TaxID=91930 RepID=A0AA38RKR5_9PEZI|nr:hypothetical protein NKR19_g7400 [Coniochaeta hoffmannii]
MSSSSDMNQYWYSNVDIHRKVITQELQYYLGPQATVRPYTFEGEDGFLVTTPGPALSDEQINDICLKSREMWERQAAARGQLNQDKPLKRPLHQPVIITKAGSSNSNRRRGTDRWRNGSGGRGEEKRRD